MNTRGGRLGLLALLAFTLAAAAPVFDGQSAVAVSDGIAKVRSAYSSTDAGKGIALFATIIQSAVTTNAMSSCAHHPFSPSAVQPSRRSS
jgi:hypothetical protein